MESDYLFIVLLAGTFLPEACVALFILKGEGTLTVHQVSIFGATSVLHPVVILREDNATVELYLSILVERNTCFGAIFPDVDSYQRKG